MCLYIYGGESGGMRLYVPLCGSIGSVLHWTSHYSRQQTYKYVVE